MRVSDYIANYLEQIGVKNVFLLSGGGMMHLLDSISRKEGISCIYNHHEQASAIAAEAYARETNSLGVCYATSGPGGTNTVTGVVGAWQDSAPVLFITGQSKRSQTIHGSNLSGLRQFGAFEVDIIPIVQSITKYAVVLDDPKMVRYHLEKAIKIALRGRPGPVFLDVPLDVQSAIIDPLTLVGYTEDCVLQIPSDNVINNIVEKLKHSKRPLILAGHGIRCAGAVDLFREVIKKLNIPVVTTQLAKDLLTYDNDLFVGHPGTKGDRAGNFAIQNADIILSIGSSLHVSTTGFELDKFAVNAYKIQVDLDTNVLQKESVGVNIKVLSDVTSLLNKINPIISNGQTLIKASDWHTKCNHWKQNYPVNKEPHTSSGDSINYYDFVDTLSDLLKGNETIVTDAGSAYYVVGQAFKTKGNQRVIVSGALGAMGYAVPASIGVSAADVAKQVICITGEGSLQLNIQELATIGYNNFNIKLFVVNNNGYLSIRNTQNNFFSGHLAGTDATSGISFPDLNKIADAYNISYMSCKNRSDLKSTISNALQEKGPVICEIFTLPHQDIIPSVQSVRLENGTMTSKPIHDMFPFLDSNELLKNMLQ